MCWCMMTWQCCRHYLAAKACIASPDDGCCGISPALAAVPQQLCLHQLQCLPGGQTAHHQAGMA